ncbi:hypothetical protein HMPREF0178_00123 [Bilophila sp. 4_1_30]|nr:hypothetical protein HMPREF0178_00123 [Bilophila sp. 4_1_30]
MFPCTRIPENVPHTEGVSGGKRRACTPGPKRGRGEAYGIGPYGRMT